MSGKGTAAGVALGLLGVATIANCYAIYDILAKKVNGKRTTTLSFTRLLQLAVHFFALVMVVFRIPLVVCDLEGTAAAVPASSIGSIATFFYYLCSEIYYVELLNIVAFQSTWLKKERIKIAQVVLAIMNIALGGAILFRYTVYTNSFDNNWASNWAQSFAFIIVFTALEGLAIAIYLYWSFTILIKNLPNADDSETSSSRMLRKVKILLFFFFIQQVLMFASYMLNGFLQKAGASALSESLTGVGSAIGGLEICVFTWIFKLTVQMFTESKNSSQKKNGKTATIKLPEHSISTAS
ncbi:hypothetical protein HDV03_003926 [Kappamyces sp. JEL0829]|nr:hypothetical protein HDV03_003926 [Kappamyces sp. JEL0829]